MCACVQVACVCACVLVCLFVCKSHFFQFNSIVRKHSDHDIIHLRFDIDIIVRQLLPQTHGELKIIIREQEFIS